MTDVKKEETTDEVNCGEDEVLQKVADRIKFFFSSANLRSDRFMKNKMLQRPDKTLEIEDLLKFKTIRALTTEVEKIAEAAEKYASDLVRLNDGRDAIGRKDDFKFKVDAEKIHAMTLFVENLPTVGNENGQARYNVNIPEIVSFFEPFGTVTLVRLRYSKQNKEKQPKQPNGTAFVEFDSEENMQKVLDHDKPLELKGSELKFQCMSEWVNRDKKNSDNEDKLSKKRPRKEENEGDEEDEIEVPEYKVDWEKGCVVSLKGLPDGCDRESILGAIKDTCEKHEMDKNPYVDYSRGQPDGAIRFKKAFEHISELVKLIKSGDIKICGEIVADAAVLDGEDEEKYWKEFAEFKRKKQQKYAMEKRNKKRKGGRGRGRN